jgi:hypothetical protein
MSEADISATGGSIPSPASQDVSGGLGAIGARASTPRIDQDGRGDLDRYATQKDFCHLEDVIASFGSGVSSELRRLETSLNDKTGSLEKSFEGKSAGLDGKIAGLEKSFDGGFATLDGKIATIDDKFVTTDGKLATIDGKLATIDVKIANIHDKLTTVDGRLATTDDKLATIDGRLATTDDKLATINVKIATIDGTLANINDKFDGLKKTIDDNTTHLKELRESDLNGVHKILYFSIALSLVFIGYSTHHALDELGAGPVRGGPIGCERWPETMISRPAPRQAMAPRSGRPRTRRLPGRGPRP